MEDRLSDKQGEMEGLCRDIKTNLGQENGRLLSNSKHESERRAWREKDIFEKGNGIREGSQKPEESVECNLTDLSTIKNAQRKQNDDFIKKSCSYNEENVNLHDPSVERCGDSANIRKEAISEHLAEMPYDTSQCGKRADIVSPEREVNENVQQDAKNISIDDNDGDRDDDECCDKRNIESRLEDLDMDHRTRTMLKGGLDLKTQSVEVRPIFPNVPYSPYASPCNSPQSNRRRPPLRESRRVSIEQSGSFLQLNQYKLLDQIGQGSYGLVKLAYSEEDSTHYAMKILSKRRLLRQTGFIKRGPKKVTSPLDRVYREIAVLKKLDHPNVVKLVEVLDDPVEDSLYMVFELVKQGEILAVPTKNPLSEERAWQVFRDTLMGLEYLHHQRIIHGDLKPGNLLLTDCGRVKIADLGVCNEFIGESAIITSGSIAGTPAFRAPETLNIGQPNIYCGKAADIWALGITLYALVFGNVPFAHNSIPILYEKIRTECVHYPDAPIISTELRDCIERMLKKGPAERITLPQLKMLKWVTKDGMQPLPSEEENCRLVHVGDDEMNGVVRSIPKLDTLILIKTMLKKHSFGNPFSKGRSKTGGSRFERFANAGRSNSAPSSCNLFSERPSSGDNILPALTEISGSYSTNEELQ
ncbi:calcium/calmodulin-dependent protein kinase kinase 1 isoform 1-T6 [Glossina fuscipes fuscipes]